MPFEAKVGFVAFRKDIENALPRGSQKRKDYRAWVGALARLYRKRSTWARGTKWVDWLERAEDGFKDNWSEVSHLKQTNVRMIATGGTALKLAIAIHYCMHASDEFRDRAIASFLDKMVFGANYVERSGPVFHYRPDSALPATYPKASLPPTYQYEREEFRQTKAALLWESGELDRSSANVAVVGSGGYGKTSLMSEVCLDKEVHNAFPGGIYWLQFGVPESEGKDRLANGFTARDAIDRMLRASKYPEGSLELIDLTTDVDAVNSLIEALPVEPLLIVADDLWTQAQVNALSFLPENVSLLATTRIRSLKNRFNEAIEIKCLTNEAAQRILLHDLGELAGSDDKRLRDVADSFRGWPLILQLANFTFKFCMLQGTPIGVILDEFETFTALEDVTGWDAPETSDTQEEKRQKFVSFCIEAGLSALPDDSYRDAFYSLAVFPDDVEIPFSVVTDYWREFIEDRHSNGERKQGIHVSPIKSNSIRSKLNDLSYFDKYDPETGMLGLHDVLLAYLRKSAKPAPLQKLHRHLLTSIKKHCSSGWETLPLNQIYGWESLPYHIDACESHDDLYGTLFEVNWLQAKWSQSIDVGLWDLCQTAKRMKANPWVADAIECSSGRGRQQNFQSFLLQVYGRLSKITEPDVLEFARNVSSRIKPTVTPIIHTLRPANPHREGYYDPDYDLLDEYRKPRIRDSFISNDGHTVYWISDDFVLHVANVPEKSAPTKIDTPFKPNRLSVSRSECEILLSSLGGRCTILDTKTGTTSDLLGGEVDGLWKASYFCEGEKSILLDRVRQGSSIVDTSGKMIEEIDGAMNLYSYFSAQVSEHNGVAVVDCYGGPKVWRSSSKKWNIPRWPRSRMLGPSDFSQDGNVAVVSARGGSEIWVLDTTCEAGLICLEQLKSEVSEVQISPDGLLVVVATEDREICLFCVQSSRYICRRRLDQSAHLMIFSSCERYLILAVGASLLLLDLDLRDVGVEINFDYVAHSIRSKGQTIFVGDALGREHVFTSSLLGRI